VQTALVDARLTVVAFAAVASSREMPDWRAYRRHVEAGRADGAEGTTGVAALRAVLGESAPRVASPPARVVAALVSFTDDHEQPVPFDVLPRAETRALLDALASYVGPPLAPPGQLAIARRIAADPWTALLACHLATRQLARGRDTRALGDDVPVAVEARCRIGACIAAFPAALSEGGDPLGDTYHYWANVIAGVTAASHGGWRGRGVERLFRAGPYLMRVVREGLFRSRLFYGDHRHVDHLGLTHGLALGR
jgi:hypothetical protein